MTNGEKLKEVFPSIELYEKSHDAIQINFNSVWWNAEYQEPSSSEKPNKSEIPTGSTTNNLALIHTEGLDEEIRCTMCTNSMKSDRGCDGSCVVNNAMYKNVMDAIEKRIQPTTKNDLGVDCISRKAVIDELKRYFHDEYYQRTSIQDCRDCFIEDVLNHLPSVTPQEPKTGHWIPVYQGDEIIDYRCSECEFGNTFGKGTYGMSYCPRCGAKMVEPQESEEV